MLTFKYRYYIMIKLHAHLSYRHFEAKNCNLCVHAVKTVFRQLQTTPQRVTYCLSIFKIMLGIFPYLYSLLYSLYNIGPYI